MGRERRGRRDAPGLCDRDQREPRQHGHLQGRHHRSGVPPRHLPNGLLRWSGRPQGRRRAAERHLATGAARLPARRCHRPDRLRQLGRLGFVGGARQRRLRHLLRQARAARHRWLEPHRLHRSRRCRQLRPAVPDLRYDLAGLQHLWWQQPVHRLAGGAGLQGQLQPTFHDALGGWRPGLGLQRRVPDGALARGQRLQCQLLHRGRRRPRRQPDAHAQGLPLGRARRVLVGWPAGQRRGRPRRRGEPRLLQRQRGLLEDTLGKRHRCVSGALPHARQLQRNRRQREDRPDGRLDGHLARPALLAAGRRRPTRERADWHDLHEQRHRRAVLDHGAGCRRQDAPVAQHQRCRARYRAGRYPACRHARLRVGQRSRQRCAARRPVPPVEHRHHVERQAARLRQQLRRRYRDALPHAVQARQRGAGVRCRHGAVELGAGCQP